MTGLRAQTYSRFVMITPICISYGGEQAQRCADAISIKACIVRQRSLIGACCVTLTFLREVKWRYGGELSQLWVRAGSGGARRALEPPCCSNFNQPYCHRERRPVGNGSGFPWCRKACQTSSEMGCRVEECCVWRRKYQARALLLVDDNGSVPGFSSSLQSV